MNTDPPATIQNRVYNAPIPSAHTATQDPRIVPTHRRSGAGSAATTGTTMSSCDNFFLNLADAASGSTTAGHPRLSACCPSVALTSTLREDTSTSSSDMLVIWGGRVMVREKASGGEAPGGRAERVCWNSAMAEGLGVGLWEGRGSAKVGSGGSAEAFLNIPSNCFLFKPWRSLGAAFPESTVPWSAYCAIASFTSSWDILVVSTMAHLERRLWGRCPS
mmetsp:Transcript_10910/g.21931  ORF Transcript_10910/g.21931 Transcript_10910/m.21931 type:complete len:219 (-) Transcript_10910:80-736(-)